MPDTPGGPADPAARFTCPVHGRIRTVAQLAFQEAERSAPTPFDPSLPPTSPAARPPFRPEHLIIAILKEGGVGASVLTNLGVDLRRVRDEIERMETSGEAAKVREVQKQKGWGTTLFPSHTVNTPSNVRVFFRKERGGDGSGNGENDQPPPAPDVVIG